MRNSAYQDWNTGSYLKGSAKYAGSVGLRTMQATQWALFETPFALLRGHGLTPTAQDRHDAGIISFAAGGVTALSRRGLGAVAAERGADTLGSSTTSNYAKTFFAANPELKGQVVVHHAVEQQVLTKFPGVVTKSEINSLENLRGVPNALNSDIHLSQIRVQWNRFYKPFVANGTQPTRAQLLQKATEIDTRFGTQFNPPLGGGR